MQPKAPRTWQAAIVVALACALFVTVTGWLMAAPADDIRTAVASSGAQSVQQAKPDQFLNAVATVLASADQTQSALYVAAAVQARPDLKSQITAAAAEMESADPATDETDHRVSPHKRRCRICHNGHTLVLPCKKAYAHLQHHPGDSPGPCCRHPHH